MMSAPPRHGPDVRDDVITFRLHDPDDEFAAVGLVQELRRPRDRTPLSKPEGADTWAVEFPRLAVDRMEYQLKVVRPDGSDEVICDPANPLRAPGVFGEKSVLELPGYQTPAWLDGPDPPDGELFATQLYSRAIRADVDVQIWTSPGADAEDPLPLLVAHDGPEYAQLSSLPRFLARMVSDGRLPPLRALLLQPPWPRDEHYSASAAYARGLVNDVLAAVDWLAPTPPDTAKVGMGASLGALAMLHAQRVRPQSFGALYLQSGSYFRQRFDKQEASFPRFRRISRFVGEVLNADSAPVAVPVTVTCGAVEENLANNRAVAAALDRQGYGVRLAVNRDAHNYVAWRDTFDPHLVDLLARVWQT
jgi:enterochelin esterase family protein